MRIPDPNKPLDRQDEDVLLTMLVWGEGRKEPDDGLAAILGTVLERNRIKGKGLKHEILRPYAYSCFNLQDPNRRKLFRPLKYGSIAEWERCLNAVAAALQSDFVSPAQGATHYCVKKLWMCPVAAKLNPKTGLMEQRRRWHDVGEVASGRTKKIITIGGHVFARTAF